MNVTTKVVAVVADMYGCGPLALVSAAAELMGVIRTLLGAPPYVLLNVTVITQLPPTVTLPVVNDPAESVEPAVTVGVALQVATPIVGSVVWVELK